MTTTPAGRPSAASLRQLAREHSKAALEVLADVATTGTSEASRVAAATALLERGYGKSAVLPGGGEALRPPTLYHRIELIDGPSDQVAPDDPG